MWKAGLSSGKIFTSRDGTWLDIQEPVKFLEVLGLKVEGASEYYLVFHAIAFPGKQGQFTAVEFGGRFGHQFRGFVIDNKGAKPRAYPVERFPYPSSLKPGENGG